MDFYGHRNLSGATGCTSKIWRCVIFQMKKYIDEGPLLTIRFIFNIHIQQSSHFLKNFQCFFLIFTYVILYPRFSETVHLQIVLLAQHLNNKVQVSLAWSSVSHNLVPTHLPTLIIYHFTLPCISTLLKHLLRPK